MKRIQNDLFIFCDLRLSEVSKRKHLTMNDTNLKIFKRDYYQCSSPTDCHAIKRLCTALTYYSKLDIQKENDQNILINFMQQIYDQYLNDYIHLVNIHCHQIEEIHKSLTNNVCDIKKCVFTSRHNKSKSNQINDPTLNLYKITMDSLHFYLYHLFDVGFRIEAKSDDIAEETKESHNHHSSEYFDVNLRRIHSLITQRKHVGISLNRIDNNNKFNIDTESTTLCM